jgi:5-methylcytosine-specific restriction endonuclease McrA
LEVERRWVTIDELKQCTNKKCLEFYPATEEFFYKQIRRTKTKGTFYVLSSHCKTCTRVVNKEHGRQNKDKRKEYFQEYYSENKEKVLQQQKEYRYENWDIRHEKHKEWIRNNKSKSKEYRDDRISKKYHEINDEEWNDCLHYFSYSCAYCGIPEEKAIEQFNNRLHKEHVEHDGENDLSNAVPACKKCNSRKWLYELDDWYNDQNPVYDIERHSRVINWISGDYEIFIKEKEITI